MVRSGLAALALFGLAGRRGADKPIDRVVSGILRFDIFSGGIFFGRVFGVSLLELELRLALAALYEVAHFADGFILKVLKLLISQQSFELVLHHDGAATGVKTFEVAALVDELCIDVLVDAGHAEDVPAVVDVEEDLSVKILVVLSIALRAFHYFGFVQVHS